MPDSFSTDTVQTGTTDQTTTTTDNTNSGSFDAGNELQRQIDGMQKRLTDKDSHINTLESENKNINEKFADMAERLDKLTTVEDTLSRMRENTESNQATALDEEDLKVKVKNLLAENTAEERADNNFKAVADVLSKKYGSDKVDETVRSVAKENGLTFDDMISLARKSPSAVYRMAGLDNMSATSTNASQSTYVGVNIDGKTKEQKLSEYATMRRESPKDFYKPEAQKAFRELCLN